MSSLRPADSTSPSVYSRFLVRPSFMRSFPFRNVPASPGLYSTYASFLGEIAHSELTYTHKLAIYLALVDHDDTLEGPATFFSDLYLVVVVGHYTHYHGAEFYLRLNFSLEYRPPSMPSHYLFLSSILSVLPMLPRA